MPVLVFMPGLVQMLVCVCLAIVRVLVGMLDVGVLVR